MRINSIYIESFGKFKKFSLEFGEGMNLIYGDNEAGKSTIMAFIEMMFYGKTAQEKSSDVSKSLRKKYAPWDGSAMSGDLEFTYEDRRYRIHKVFKKTIKSDEIALYDADTGEELPLDKDEEIGKKFFGIDVGSFEKSVFISGFGGFATQGQTNEDIAVRLSNLVTTLDEDVSQSQVLGRLSTAREMLRSRSGKKGILSDLEGKRIQLKDDLVESKRIAKEQLEIKNKQQELIKQQNGLLIQKEIINSNKKTAQLQQQLQEINAKLDRYVSLSEEGNRVLLGKNEFESDKYYFETFPDYINGADELLRAVNSQANLATQLKEKATVDFVNIEDSDIVKARALEKKRVRVSGLYDMVCDSYIPALEEYNQAKKSKEECQELMDNLIPPAKKWLITGVTFVLAGIVSLAGILLTIVMAAVAVLFVMAGLYFIIRYSDSVKKYKTEEEHITRLIEEHANAEKEKNNILYRVKHKLLDKGGEFFGYADCDFKAIMEQEYKCCCGELADLYDHYLVENIDELEECASKNNEAKVNAALYENALKELEAKQNAYNLYAGNTDLESLRLRWREVKDAEISFKAKAGMPVESLEDILAKITENINLLKVEKTDLETSLLKESAIMEEHKQKSKEFIQNEDEAFSERELEAELSYISEQLIDLAAMMKLSAREPEQIEEELRENAEEYEEKKFLYECLVLAEDNMKKAVDDISRSFGPILNSKTAQIFSDITGGKYDKVMVDKEYGIQVKEQQGTYHEWKFLSNGTTDQAYLSLRLAMTELITENGEKLPLMLDDILLQYDKERAERAMNYLAEYAKEAQILMFTCHQPDSEWKHDGVNMLEL